MKKMIFNKFILLTLCFAFSITTFAQNVENTTPSQSESTKKKASLVRIGLPSIKAGTVGEGINAQELSAAIQNTLGEYLKGTHIELVPLESKIPQAVDAEAKEKGCDFILYAAVSHKKGGGFGMFKALAPVLSNVVPMAGMGSGTAGAVMGSVASTAISTAAGATQNVKPKDEITLDVKLKKGESFAFNKLYKAKAKSGGEDLISSMIEQVAQAILDAATK